MTLSSIFSTKLGSKVKKDIQQKNRDKAQRIFDLLDVNHDLVIDAEDLQNVTHLMGSMIERWEATTYIRELGFNDSITLSQFITYYGTKRRGQLGKMIRTLKKRFRQAGRKDYVLPISNEEDDQPTCSYCPYCGQTAHPIEDCTSPTAVQHLQRIELEEAAKQQAKEFAVRLRKVEEMTDTMNQANVMARLMTDKIAPNPFTPSPNYADLNRRLAEINIDREPSINPFTQQYPTPKATVPTELPELPSFQTTYVPSIENVDFSAGPLTLHETRIGFKEQTHIPSPVIISDPEETPASHSEHTTPQVTESSAEVIDLQLRQAQAEVRDTRNQMKDTLEDNQNLEEMHEIMNRKYQNLSTSYNKVSQQLEDCLTQKQRLEQTLAQKVVSAQPKRRRIKTYGPKEYAERYKTKGHRMRKNFFPNVTEKTRKAIEELVDAGKWENVQDKEGFTTTTYVIESDNPKVIYQHDSSSPEESSDSSDESKENAPTVMPIRRRSIQVYQPIQVRINELPTFSGSGEDGIVTFYNKLHNLLDLSDWDDQQKAQITLNRFTGRALTIAMQHRQEQEEYHLPMTMISLQRAMQRAFLTNSRSRQLQTKLFKLRQGTLDIRQYITALEALFREGQIHDEQLRMAALINGLKRPISLHIQTGNYKTYHRAVEAALTYSDAVYGTNTFTEEKPMSVAAILKHATEQDMESNKKQRLVDTQPHKRELKICSRCKQVGHLAQNCYSNIMRRPPPQCLKCGRIGHQTAQCKDQQMQPSRIENHPQQREPRPPIPARVPTRTVEQRQALTEAKKLAITCFKCGNKGHFANECPKGNAKVVACIQQEQVCTLTVQQNKIYMKIEDALTVPFMIDTGAVQNFVSERTWQQLVNQQPELQLREQYANESFTAAEGHKFTSKTKVTLRITLITKGTQYDWQTLFYVMNNIDFNLLGLPFLKQAKAQVRFDNGHLQFCIPSNH